LSIKIIIFSLLSIIIFTFPVTADTPDYYLQRGKLQFRGGMYNYALHSLDSALRMDPSLYEAANLIAEIYIIQNNREKALEYIKKSISAMDDQPDAHTLLAEQYEYFHDDKMSFKSYKRAVEIDPKHVRANAALIRYYLVKNEKEAAENAFRISRDEGAKKNTGLIKRAEKYLKEGKRTDALRIYETVLKISPASEEIYLKVFELRRNNGEMAQAAGILEQYKFIRPDHEKTHLLLARIYTDHRLPGGRKRNLDHAIMNLKKALEINPQGYDAHYQLSDIYRIVNDPDMSEKHQKLGRKNEELEK
jgi:Tfp pilus assembly protein PilF